MDTMQKGQLFTLKSVKHDQRFHRAWLTNEVLYRDEHVLIGTNDKTIVKEANKKEWRTKERAIFYFDNRYWFNVVILLSGETHYYYYYYCNMAAPLRYVDGVAQYIDYDIDIIVQANYRYEVVDQIEFLQNCQVYSYPRQLISQLKTHQGILENWIRERKGPFDPSFLTGWLQEI